MSSSAREKAESAKAYIERKYTKLKTEEKERKEGAYLSVSYWPRLTRFALTAWDLLQKKMDKLNLNEQEQEIIKQDILHKEAELNRKARRKISVFDFDPLKIIGRGAFGEVRVCRLKETNEIVAMKKMKKSEMIYKNQVSHVKAERDVLVKARNQWIVDLKYSFQVTSYSATTSLTLPLFAHCRTRRTSTSSWSILLAAT